MSYENIESLVSDMVGTRKRMSKKNADSDLDEAFKILSKLQKSVREMATDHFFPKAQHIIVSLIRRYIKLKSIQNWADFERALPEKPRAEFFLVIKDIKSCYTRYYYDFEMTWEELESLLEKYFPDVMTLFQFLRRELTISRKLPLS
jgi:hypothetical protein